MVSSLVALICLAAPGPAKLTPVPFLGAREPYFLGSGGAGAGGATAGRWDFLIGPDYTSPNFIKSEILSLIVDGKPIALNFEIHRNRRSGIFFGTERVAGCEVTVTDFTNDGSAWVARLVRVANLSPNRAKKIAVQAVVVPVGGPKAGMTSSIEDGAVQIVASKSAYCFGGETKNWWPRASVIMFNAPCSATAEGAGYALTTSPQLIAASHLLSVGLYHWQHYDEGKPASRYVAQVRLHYPEADLARSLRQWRRWCSKGTKLRIPDPKAREVVEGSLVACKMQQDRDGGLIAGARRYANSYVRDSHGGLRLFLATGHVAEAKKIVETIHQKWKVAGFIPNYWSMGSDAFLGRSFVNDASEITGYYVMMIRDTYAATKDLRFVDSVADAMKYAVDAQLDFMAKHGWRITFNGDETEQYCDRIDGQEYGGFPAFDEWKRTNWSFPSAAIACASTQFFIDYLRLKGRRAEAARYRAKLKLVKDGIDATFLRDGVHAWMRTKEGAWPLTTVPNYDLIPLWAGARLNGDRQQSDARAMKGLLDPKTGFLPTAPPKVEGFCGHNLGYMLYDLAELHDPLGATVYHTIMHSTLFGCWGTASEFYGPGGVPNGHNFRVFESGIDAEAIIRFFSVAPKGRPWIVGGAQDRYRTQMMDVFPSDSCHEVAF